MIHQVYSIAEEIKRLREERDMTQEELAESAEISLKPLKQSGEWFQNDWYENI